MTKRTKQDRDFDTQKHFEVEIIGCYNWAIKYQDSRERLTATLLGRVYSKADYKKLPMYRRDMLYMVDKTMNTVLNMHHLTWKVYHPVLGHLDSKLPKNRALLEGKWAELEDNGKFFYKDSDNQY